MPPFQPNRKEGFSGDSGKNNFPRARRLRERAEFLYIGKFGARHHSRHFIGLFLENDESPSRLGVTVSRKVGGAVKRNRVKRLVREFFRLHGRESLGNTDLSVIGKRGAADLAQGEVFRQLQSLVRGYIGDSHRESITRAENVEPK